MGEKTGSDVETPIDQLIELVDKNGKITTKDAAKKLGIDEAKVREWADFLEKHGLVELNVNFFTIRLVSKKGGGS